MVALPPMQGYATEAAMTPGSDLPARLRALAGVLTTAIDNLWRDTARLDEGYVRLTESTARTIRRSLQDAAAALQGSETAPPSDAELQLGPIRKRLERGQYRTLPPETIEGDIAFLLRVAADAPAPAPQGWRPIETWRGEEEAFFWLVKKNGHSSSLYPRLYHGEFGYWWSGAKATHWMPIPDPPAPPPPAPDREEA